jgi:hypothetical protein
MSIMDANSWFYTVTSVLDVPRMPMHEYQRAVMVREKKEQIGISYTQEGISHDHKPVGHRQTKGLEVEVKQESAGCGIRPLSSLSHKLRAEPGGMRRMETSLGPML